MTRHAPLIVDVDDTILDWIGSFRSFMSERLGRDIEGVPNGWDMSSWLGIPADMVVRHIQDHNMSAHFGCLLPIHGAQETLLEAREREIPIHVITSCSTDPVTVSRRHDNLLTVFGDVFSSITCLDLDKPKASELSRVLDLDGAGIWVEDNHMKALEGHMLGHQAFVLRRGHNRDQEDSCDAGLSWVDHWDEIRTHLPDLAPSPPEEDEHISGCLNGL